MFKGKEDFVWDRELRTGDWSVECGITSGQVLIVQCPKVALGGGKHTVV